MLSSLSVSLSHLFRKKKMTKREERTSSAFLLYSTLSTMALEFWVNSFRVSFFVTVVIAVVVVVVVAVAVLHYNKDIY